MSRWESLASLRAAVARIERGPSARDGGVLPLGVAAIDAALEEGGLRAGALHEIAGPAADGFAAALAGRLAARGGGMVLWCAAGQGQSALHPPGWGWRRRGCCWCAAATWWSCWRRRRKGCGAPGWPQSWPKPFARPG